VRQRPDTLPGGRWGGPSPTGQGADWPRAPRAAGMIQAGPRRNGGPCGHGFC
jgi:hypothetical protein